MSIQSKRRYTFPFAFQGQRSNLICFLFLIKLGLSIALVLFLNLGTSLKDNLTELNNSLNSEYFGFEESEGADESDDSNEFNESDEDETIGTEYFTLPHFDINNPICEIAPKTIFIKNTFLEKISPPPKA